MRLMRIANHFALHVAILFAVFMLALSSRSIAQDIPVVMDPAIDRAVGAALVMVPEYEGADKYTIAGAPILHYRFWGWRYAQVLGNKAFVNLVDHRNFEAGFKGVYRLGRVNADDAAVDALASVDNSLEIGGFVGYKHFFDKDPRHRLVTNLGLTQDVSDGHDGFVGELSTAYWRPLAQKFVLGLRANVSYASENYMSTNFDVTASGAAASGLSQFSADAGFKDVGLTLMGLYHLTQNWHLGGGVQYKRLLSDAADSPIVDDRGSANQLFVGASVIYTWQQK